MINEQQYAGYQHFSSFGQAQNWANKKKEKCRKGRKGRKGSIKNILAEGQTENIEKYGII